MADDAAACPAARSISAPLTSPASRGEASSRRSSRSGIPSWCAASSSRAPGRYWTPTFAPGSTSSAGLVEVAPCERAFLEWFYLWIYTARAHNDGTVDQIIEEVLAFPHKQSNEDVQRFLDIFVDHDTTHRLPQITAPTLVLAGGRDPTSRPPLCQAVAELIPGAVFEVMEEEGAPALPGGPRRVERPRRRLLAGGRGVSLSRGELSRASWRTARPACPLAAHRSRWRRR